MSRLLLLVGSRTGLETEARRARLVAQRSRYPTCRRPLRNPVRVRPGTGDRASRVAGGADLDVDVGHVALDGAHAEDELVGDVVVRQSACDQSKHLGLPRREPADARLGSAGAELLQRLPCARLGLPRWTVTPGHAQHGGELEPRESGVVAGAG